MAVTVTTGLLAAGAFAAWSPDPAAADTVVQAAEGAQLVLPGGQVRPARPGDSVPRGATLRTAQAGQAVLRTAGRETWVGAASAVRVDDGARQELTAGSVMVDARRAAGLALVTDVAEVTASRGALVRVERGPMLRVAEFAGTSAIVPHGRRASTGVGALHQVQVALGGLPGAVTALALTSDRWERAMVGDLVSEDADLTGLAVGLDGPGPAGQAVLAVLQAGLRSAAPPQAGAPRSEQTLAWGLAAAAAAPASDSIRSIAQPNAVAARYAEVRGLRNEGGSWAVVARLVGADVDGVGGLLERLIQPAGAPTGGPAGQNTLFGPASPTGSLLLSGSPFVALTPGSTAGRGNGPGTLPGAGRPGPTPAAGTPAGAPASPTPSGAVRTVVETVVALLPTPLPTPSLRTGVVGAGTGLPG